MRKIIQIAVAGTVENSQTQAEAYILALCDDGTVWSTTNRLGGWQKFPEIPQDAGWSEAAERELSTTNINNKTT